MQDEKTLTTLDEVRVFSDPYRLQILQQFYSLGVPATVKQVADRMKEVPANVYYHVKKMEKAGILTLVYTENINGITAKYYEPTASYFDIGYKNVEEITKDLLLSETQKVISNIYESSKNVVLNQLKKKPDEEKRKFDFHVLMETTYLTEEQYKEICKYMMEFCKMNSKKTADKKEYHFFSVIGETKSL